MMAMDLNNKQVTVVGLGNTGLSALRWLLAKGAHVLVMDTRDNPPGLSDVQENYPQVPMHFGGLDAERLTQSDLVVLSPGVALSEPEVQQALNAGVPVVGDVELFAMYRNQNTKVIGITGSNGKTTVTSLVGEMCKAAGLTTIVAGNIGLPVLDALMMDVPDVYVLELSSFQLETTSNLVLDAATMLNLSEDHMDRYTDVAAYAAAKARIFYHAKHQVLNRDDAWSMLMVRPQLTHQTFGLESDVNDLGVDIVDGEAWLSDAGKHLINSADLHIKGAHNVANALAAIGLCRAIGLEYAPILQALYQFKGLPHRVEWVAEINHVDYFNDSKGTNVGATCAALSGLPPKVVLIAGGDGKGQSFSPLEQPVRENARALVLIGADAKAIESAMLDTGVPMYHALDMNEAVIIAQKMAQKNDSILLSPACASFDMYENYIARGEAFVSAVHALEQGVAC